MSNNSQSLRSTLFSLTALAALTTLTPSPANSKEPGWSPVIIARGEYRERLQATPIEYRPYRPLHIYGNTVRRQYHRGTPLPLPQPVVRPMINAVLP